MNEHVFTLFEVVVIFLNAKAAKSKFIQIDFEWSIAGDQDIDAQIELLTANE